MRIANHARSPLLCFLRSTPTQRPGYLGGDIMIGHASHVEYLKTLTPAELEQELNQAITDSLQELVACVQKALPQGGNTLHACVIDDFQIIETELRDHECLVRFRFTASARQGI